jgi:hypothetical protein
MEKIDARTHNQQTQYELRKQIIRLRKRGLSTKEVADLGPQRILCKWFFS